MLKLFIIVLQIKYINIYTNHNILLFVSHVLVFYFVII